MSEKYEAHRPTGARPGGAGADRVEELLGLLPRILADVGELREIMTGRMKSHLTVEEVADRTGRSPYTVRRWVAEGVISAVRVEGTGPRGRLLVPCSELRKLVAAGRGSRLDESASFDAPGASGGQSR
jgi:excisionase family DNA binding protein